MKYHIHESDLIVDMIVDKDFLKKNGDTIDMKRNKLRSKSSYTVKALQKVYIKGNFQQHVYGVIEGITNAMS